MLTHTHTAFPDTLSVHQSTGIMWNLTSTSPKPTLLHTLLVQEWLRCPLQMSDKGLSCCKLMVMAMCAPCLFIPGEECLSWLSGIIKIFPCLETAWNCSLRLNEWANVQVERWNKCGTFSQKLKWQSPRMAIEWSYGITKPLDRGVLSQGCVYVCLCVDTQHTPQHSQ